MNDTPSLSAETFIERWSDPDGSERANFQGFAIDLCALLGVETPSEAKADNAQYGFERPIKVRRLEGKGTTNYIDLYRRGCFVLEAKQSKKRQKLTLKQTYQLELGETGGKGAGGGKGWDVLMQNARQQAENYAKNLPSEEGWPPFLVIVDVGNVIEVFADFSLQGKHYAQFPDRQSYRIRMDDLAREEVRDRLRLIWTDPMALNPARRTAEVTREIASLLAKLSKALETRMDRALDQKQRPEVLAHERRAITENVAMFLMRCLFTMFAEDVKLLPRDSFTELLKSYRGDASSLHHKLNALWREMDNGAKHADGHSIVIDAKILHFNGGLFKDSRALPITEDDLELLIIAAERDWSAVEPAIFGTLLEQALDPRERHRLGAHYTPRAYVERLVVATIIDPLSEDWTNVRTAAAQLAEAGDTKGAITAVRDFHRGLCETRVLDPACGTGNFLYVSLELMKRLEGQVLEMLMDLGDEQYTFELDRHTINPHQFLGLEINPRAAAIAELVLWIGYLQWHFRTRGATMPAQPVLTKFDNIECRDAILASDSWDVLRDDTGKPITRWDGVTFKRHPITGEEIPDEAARFELRRYVNPRRAKWPSAEFIIGNPPFVGKGAALRSAFGDGYVEAVFGAWKHIPQSTDFVMFWWDHSAQLLSENKIRAFGLITTNSITGIFNRRIVKKWITKKKPISLYLSIPDHPWEKTKDKANVRISMTVANNLGQRGVCLKTIREERLNSDSPYIEYEEILGKIGETLKIGVDTGGSTQLTSNKNISWNGVMLACSGFRIKNSGLSRLTFNSSKLLKRFLHGSDLTDRLEGEYVIDTFGYTEEALRDEHPSISQYLYDHVKPVRDHARDKKFRSEWWLFGRNRPSMRQSFKAISRYIATTETAKHRFFQFIDSEVVPDHMIIAIGIDDAAILAMLSSRIHVTWALAAGGRLGVGNDPRYNKTRCFDPFPFPDPPAPLRTRLRDLGERLDAHRKERLAAHEFLTMTKMYNVLEKLRAETPLTDAETDIYEAGLVGILRQAHDDIDAAVAEAYGWPVDLSDEEILTRLVALNKERAAEEAEGTIRWLRPDFQAPRDTRAGKATQIEADLVAADTKAKKPRLPKPLPERVAAIRALLEAEEDAITLPDLARRFSQGRKVENQVAEVVDTLILLGQAEEVPDGYLSKS